MERLTGKYKNKNGAILYERKEATIKNQHLIDKLGAYEEAEEQGLLLRLPCKVGTPVYMVAEDCGGDTLDCRRGECEGCSYLYSFVEENAFDTYMVDDIGKTVFLTKEEAEQTLAEMKGGSNEV